MTPDSTTADLPADITALLEEIDEFIEREIEPLEREGDNARFFDHRREIARTDFEAGGIPSREWEDLLAEAQRRADRAGLLRFALPAELGGRDGSNLAMAVVREHLYQRGIGLHNDPQSEVSIIGNFPTVILAHEFGTAEQREEFVEPGLRGERSLAFGLTEPNHGSDATYLETTARRDGDEWVINGVKRFNSGMHRATHDLVFARTSGSPGEAQGITAFIVPRDAPGLDVALPLVDLQPADRPRGGGARRRARGRRRDPRRARGPGSSWRSASSTRTASARPHRAWGRPPTASTRRSAGRASAPPGASRCGGTRASSSRSPSCGPTASSCAAWCGARPRRSTAAITWR